LDFVFGYDFFISYKWADGRRYAAALARALKTSGYQVFLDADEYAAGDDWQRIGAWTLRRTSRLILVATAAALDTPAEETPVEREVRIFAATGRRIIAIAFAPSTGDSRSDRAASTLEKARPQSRVLAHLPPSILDIVEDERLQDVGPSSSTIHEIQRTFDLLKQNDRRVRLLLAALTVLLLATAAAIVAGVRARAAQHQEAEARSRAEASEGRALTSQKQVASQLAKALHRLSQQTAPQELLTRFALAGRAAAVAPSDDPQLNDYLDRVIHLSTRLPDGVINLPLEEDVSSATFNGDLSLTAAVTASGQVRVFTVPEGRALFVPEDVNTAGHIGPAPAFDQDGNRLTVYRKWFHPEPDPDEHSAYVLRVEWNPITGKRYTPVDDGRISPDDLPFTVLAAITRKDSSRKTDSVVQFSGIPQTGIGRHGRTILTMLTNGTVLSWPTVPHGQFATTERLGSHWSAAVFAGDRLVSLGNHEVTSWPITSRSKRWSKTLPQQREPNEALLVSPDSSLVFAASRLFRIEDGATVSTSEPDRTDQYDGLGTGIAAFGAIVSAWRFGWEAGDDLLLQTQRVAGAATPERCAHVGPGETRPLEFGQFLRNGEYFLTNTGGSFKIVDVCGGQTLAAFGASERSALSPSITRHLLTRVSTIRQEPGRDGALQLLIADGPTVLATGKGDVNGVVRLTGGNIIVNPRDPAFRDPQLASISRDGRLLATTVGATLRVWDAQSGDAVTEPIAADATILDLVFSPDSRSVRLAIADGSVMTVTLRFDWHGRPQWIEGLSEALTGIRVEADSRSARLPISAVRAARQALVSRLKAAGDNDTSAKYLMATFFTEDVVGK
jgi:WD40 repeat protein